MTMMHAVRPASAVRRCTRARAPRSALALAHGADVPQPLPPPSPPNPHLYAPAAFACPTPPRLGPARRDASNAPSGNESRSSGNGSEPRSNELKSSENGNGNGNGSGSGDISDQEWEIRTGRAIYILQQTLPGFFHTGLVASLAEDDNSARTGGGGGEAQGIYSPRVRLAYTPPTALPPPFPRTLHVEGLPLYMASSAFVRHTLNALYTDLHVELRRVRVHGPRTGTPAPGPDPGPTWSDADNRRPRRTTRDKSLFVGLAVSGVARVSGARGGWEVHSTYAFSPVSGLIHQHTIDSIEPAPHQAVFDALRGALCKLGLADGPGRESPGAARSQPHTHARQG